MPILALNADGQITLAAELLDHLGVEAGDNLEVVRLPEGRIELQAPSSVGRSFSLPKRDDGPCLPNEAVDKVSAEGWFGVR